jgi:methylmalonyl-CoA mutase, C-terminal domain
MSEHRARVLVAKPGLDGHDRGAKVVAYALREAGCEVIYLGLRCDAARIIQAAVDEDVDVVGISVLSGAHLPLARELVAARHDHGIDDVPIIVGGTVPPRDIAPLLDLGIAEVFPVGTAIDDVVARVIALAGGTRNQSEVPSG